jgi:hypothetical protein
MNPGTTIFIVVGIIGLMLYALKALKAPLEAFTGSPFEDANSLSDLFSTPDITNENGITSNMINVDYPNLLQNLPFRNTEPLPQRDFLSETVTNPQVSIMPSPLDYAPTQAPVIPQLSNPPVNPSQTISDQQGASLQKETFEVNKNLAEALDGPQKRKKNNIKKTRCPAMPDMSLYIRKDQIPCWGCVLK